MGKSRLFQKRKVDLGKGQNVFPKHEYESGIDPTGFEMLSLTVMQEAISPCQGYFYCAGLIFWVLKLFKI